MNQTPVIKKTIPDDLCAMEFSVAHWMLIAAVLAGGKPQPHHARNLEWLRAHIHNRLAVHMEIVQDGAPWQD